MLSMILPDKNGKLDDVVLGYDKPEDYKGDTTYFGAIVGRVANRIAGAEFTLDGNVYKLVANEGNNTLHGGKIGFSQVFWTAEVYKPDSHITFTYNSYNGEQGFPGDLSVSVTYMLIGTNKLGVRMLAKPLNKPTPVNIAFHSYWNLGGHKSGSILNNKVRLYASAFTPVDTQLIPTGEITPTAGSPYDFSTMHEISEMFGQIPGGYDFNYVLDQGNPDHLRRAADVEDTVSGRKLELWTNQPGVQFYTGNMLKDEKGKDGAVYKANDALCLETQGYPDSVNHPNFPSQIVYPGQTYKHIMVFRFTSN